MLIIPRGREESIVIGDSVVVTVEEIGGAEVRLRIEHPEAASVRPGEALVAAEWESSL
ncbi:MAG: carbon storage regulator [Pirellulales bacterium]|jgi:carbon storage regulator CsrA|nr:carbon storage regulator [Thermoguttaceae bacterium]MDD4787136.1 carbon storage regulator [Pirellulales bacterium]MDI9446902.1 carbon storage regulator [Planctomycetota bacterium]NLZ03041.1 carbon storage regulator [Pirellulaceae bacterium]